jgi:mevalonate kinase
MSAPNIELVPQLEQQVKLDDNGEEYAEYLIDGQVVSEEQWVAQRQENLDRQQQHMMEVSRWMDDQQTAEAAAAVEEDARLAERREKAHAELAALGISPETIETMLRGL